LNLHSFPTRRSSDLKLGKLRSHYLGKLNIINRSLADERGTKEEQKVLERKKKFCEGMLGTIKECCLKVGNVAFQKAIVKFLEGRSEEHTSELQSRFD